MRQLESTQEHGALSGLGFDATKTFGQPTLNAQLDALTMACYERDDWVICSITVCRFLTD